MQLTYIFTKAGAYLAFCFLLVAGSSNTWADTEYIEDDCGSLSMASFATSVDGKYTVDIQGAIHGSWGHMAYVYLDGATNYSYNWNSYFSNSLATTIGPYTDAHLFKLVMRDNDPHNICTISLELIVGDTEKDPLELSNNICSTILELDDSAFKKPAAQRKNALCNKLEAVSIHIGYAVDAGDPYTSNLFYTDAIAKLTHDIGAKMDGSFSGQQKNDWIIDAGTQAIVHPMVNELIEVLQSRM
jgi:hypothetical protein